MQGIKQRSCARTHTHIFYAIFIQLRFTLFMHEHDDNAIIFY